MKRTDNLLKSPEVVALEREIAAYRQRVAFMAEERHRLIAFILRLATALELPAGITMDEEIPIAEMSHVAAITLPTGQISWHLPSQSLSLFQDAPPFRFHVEDDIPKETYYQRMEHPFSAHWSLFSDAWPFVSLPQEQERNAFFTQKTVKSVAVSSSDMIPLHAPFARRSPNQHGTVQMAILSPSSTSFQ